MRTAHARRATGALCFAIAAACGGDATAPKPEAPPPAPPANEGLWTSDAAVPTILRLSPGQLQAGGRLEAATSITTSSAKLFPANSIAFAADGTLWISSQEDSTLLAFPPAALSTSGPQAAAVTIDGGGGSLGVPSAMAFDARGALWVANFGSGTLVRFDAAQLAASGAPAPAVVLTGVRRPRGIAFDAAGALWVSLGAPDRIVKYSPAQLAASGAPEPEVVLSYAELSLRTPSGIAFDAEGRLWVANLHGQSIDAFDPGQLAASGSPPPAVTIALPESRAVLPTGLAFSGAGSLWVLGADGSLLEYDRGSLARSGSPAPRVEIGLQGHALFWSLAFWPRPAGLPLR